jgi:hypothetical protein
MMAYRLRLFMLHYGVKFIYPRSTMPRTPESISEIKSVLIPISAQERFDVLEQARLREAALFSMDSFPATDHLEIQEDTGDCIISTGVDNFIAIRALTGAVRNLSVRTMVQSQKLVIPTDISKESIQALAADELSNDKKVAIGRVTIAEAPSFTSKATDTESIYFTSPSKGVRLAAEGIQRYMALRVEESEELLDRVQQAQRAIGGVV